MKLLNRIRAWLLNREVTRMKCKLAIKEDTIRGMEDTIAFYRDAYRDEVIRNLGLTPSETSLKVGGTRNEAGINLSHKEDI